MLCVFHPPGYENERRYIYDVLLGDFLGLAYRARVQERSNVCLRCADAGASGELVMADILFQTPAEHWLKPSSLPGRPLERWDLSAYPAAGQLLEPEIPVLYGRRLKEGFFCREHAAGINLGLDIFGSAFFMLTRYEEVVTGAADGRGRFPAAASLACREGFLHRPLVNEYVELLWWFIKTLWPGLPRRQRTFRVYPSHDVDWPLCVAGRPAVKVLKSAVADVVVHRRPGSAWRRLRSLAGTRLGNVDADICNTFDCLMELNEYRGLRSAFYFIADNDGDEINGVYNLRDPWLRHLLRRIHARGHEIGLHPGYRAMLEPVRVRHEFALLRAACREENIVQHCWGGRQHYLRWKAPDTWQAWDDAGLDYDSTLSFADRAGFRSGVCYAYRVFNLLSRRKLELLERPLVVMDGTLFGKNYMNLNAGQARQEIMSLRDACKKFAGDFTILWHNNRLIEQRDVNFYRDILCCL